MKTLSLSLCALLTTAAAVPALAQSRPAATAKPAASKTSTTAKPATAASKPASTAKPTTVSKPATTSKPAAAPAAASKPAAAPQPAPAAKAAPAKPAKSTSTSSANDTFGKGSTAANLGIGFGLGYSYYGTLHATPAMSLSVERGFIEGVGPGIIGIGGLVGYKGYSYSYAGGTYKASWSNILISARGTYHYNILEHPKLDTYAGISLGVRLQTWKDTYYDNTPGLSGYRGSSSYVTSGIFLGARYLFTDNIGAFGELGYDMSLLKVGLTAKF